MLYLVYCVMKAPVAGGEPMTGVMGQAVSFVAAHGLAAAVSELAAAECAPPVPELLAYGGVVAEIHRRQAVIPMRYGCFLEGLPAVERLLEEKKNQYEALLDELDGCVEMGIRILLPERAAAPPAAVAPGDGAGYLAMRKAHYRMREEDSRHHQVLLDRYVLAFAGLHGKHRTETIAKDGSIILSLYFLIPESQVDRFREIFRQLAEPEAAKTLISGPWPPYNFATPDLPSGVVADPEARP